MILSNVAVAEAPLLGGKAVPGPEAGVLALSVESEDGALAAWEGAETGVSAAWDPVGDFLGAAVASSDDALGAAEDSSDDALGAAEDSLGDALGAAAMGACAREWAFPIDTVSSPKAKAKKISALSLAILSVGQVATVEE